MTESNQQDRYSSFTSTQEDITTVENLSIETVLSADLSSGHETAPNDDDDDDDPTLQLSFSPEENISFESSSHEGDRHRHRRSKTSEEEEEEDDDVSEETTSTASTRPFSPNQNQRKHFSKTPPRRPTSSSSSSSQRYMEAAVTKAVEEDDLLYDEEEEESTIRIQDSPSSSRALLEKLLLEEDGDEEDPTKFLLMQSVNWHKQVQKMGMNNARMNEEEEEEERLDDDDPLDKYTSHIEDDTGPLRINLQQLHSSHPNDTTRHETSLQNVSVDWGGFEEMNPPMVPGFMNQDPFDTQSSYISSEEDDDDDDDNLVNSDEDEMRMMKRERRAARRISRTQHAIAKKSPTMETIKTLARSEKVILTHAMSAYLPPPPPPPSLPTRRLTMQNAMKVQTKSYTLAQSQSTNKDGVTEDTSPSTFMEDTESAYPDVEVCLSQSDGVEGDSMDPISNNQEIHPETSILILPSGRPALLPQSTSVPIAILNPDPLDFALVSKQHHPEEYLSDSMTMDTLHHEGQVSQTTLKDTEKDSLRRSFHQSIPASVLVNLSHKRYERRRLAAMEIEKVVRNLVVPGGGGGSLSLEDPNMERARAILLMLSEDYIKSTNEDARKGGVVALAACAIAFKKGQEKDSFVMESKDLILASVIYACQDNSSRVRYYATESLFNVIKVLPVLAVQHFIVLLELLRSLCADVDTDVRSGAELLDKKLKEIVISAITSGSLSPDACVPIFARFAHIRHKPTKKLTLSWLQEFTNKLIGAPLLQFIHFFIVDIFAIIADPNLSMRQLAFQFLNSTLSKILMTNEDFEDSGAVPIDFDKIIQSLVTTMEHPDPLVRKVAMYWIARIVTTFIPPPTGSEDKLSQDNVNPATVSVRSTLPHVLPGILLSIGDTFQLKPPSKDAFLPEHTTHALAEQTNECLIDAVTSGGKLYIPLLAGFIIALLEELETPGGLSGRNPPAVERKPNRLDVKSDGTGIESTGWFRSSESEIQKQSMNEMSCTCALNWITLLYDHVVPEALKKEYAAEFISPVMKLIAIAPQVISYKCLEVLSRITISASPMSEVQVDDENLENPMTESGADFALGVLSPSQRMLFSRDREVFKEFIRLHAQHYHLMPGLFRLLCHMCSLQPPEFIFVSLGLELDLFVRQKLSKWGRASSDKKNHRMADERIARDLEFVSNFVQVMIHVFLTSTETTSLRSILKDCMAFDVKSSRDKRRVQMFSILLNTFGHNIVAALSLCLWAGAFRTASLFINNIDTLDINLAFYLELDQLVEYLERPLFRHLHLLMLQQDEGRTHEGSSIMLYRVLKSILMALPQSTSYMILKERLTSVSRFYLNMRSQSNGMVSDAHFTRAFVDNLLEIRTLHCDVKWRSIRASSLEPVVGMELHEEEEPPVNQES